MLLDPLEQQFEGRLAAAVRQRDPRICVEHWQEEFFTYGEVLDGTAEEDIARFIVRSTNDQSELVGVDAALDYPLFNTLKPVVKGFAAPSVVVDMYHRRKLIEQDILSSQGDATRFFVTRSRWFYGQRSASCHSCHFASFGSTDTPPLKIASSVTFT
jgi:hypothetical protein